MRTIKLNKDILKLAEKFIQAKHTFGNGKYQITDEVVILGNKLWYNQYILFSFEETLYRACEISHLNNMIYTSSDGSNYTELQLYDVQKFIFIHKEKIIKLDASELSTFDEDDIFAYSTIADYTDLILNSMLHLCYFKKKYGFYAAEMNYDILLNVIKSDPQLLESEWNCT